MENTIDLQELTSLECSECSGGGFAYDVGCIVGFLFRYASGPAGQAEAYATWIYQHPK